MRVEDGFQPVPFSEGHPYLTDPALPRLLKRVLPQTVHDEVHLDLVRFGKEVTTTLRAHSERASPPTLTQYNQWGQRVDKLETSEGWRALKHISQREGIPAIFYEREYGEYSRLYGFAKILLMIGDSVEIFCPISMTDGCARVLELFGTPEMKRDVFSRLISRDPSFAFTSGQWMTERTGGSDVSQTETTANPSSESPSIGPKYTLDGFKWFSSATDSDVAVALARTGSPSDGSRSLSLFLVPLRLPLLREPGTPIPTSTSNGILVHRLKNKIGTHALPTAELSLNSTEAYLLGPLHKGVKTITPVLNITRIYSAIASLGLLRKCLAIATSYATTRTVHNQTQNSPQLLSDTPLHVAQLASINLTYRALTHLIFGAVRLLGQTECHNTNAAQGGNSSEGQRLRILTPVVKAFAAEKCVTAMEEAMSALGGAGYMEENGIGRAIRDGLVEKIWEGTITVLSLDLVRAAREAEAMNAFITWANTIVLSCPPALMERLKPQIATLTDALTMLSTTYISPIPPLLPRPALFLTGHIASSLYLLEHAIWTFTTNEMGLDTDVEVCKRWVEEGGLVGVLEDVSRAMVFGKERIGGDKEIVFGSGGKVKL